MVWLLMSRGARKRRRAKKLLQGAVFALEKSATNQAASNHNRGSFVEQQDALNCLQIFSVVKSSQNLKIITDGGVVKNLALVLHNLKPQLSEGATQGNRGCLTGPSKQNVQTALTSLSILNNLASFGSGTSGQAEELRKQILHQGILDLVLELTTTSKDIPLLEAYARLLNSMTSLINGNNADSKALDNLDLNTYLINLVKTFKSFKDSKKEGAAVHAQREISGVDNAVNALFNLAKESKNANNEALDLIVQYYFDAYITNGSLVEKEKGVEKMLEFLSSGAVDKKREATLRYGAVEVVIQNVLTKGSKMTTKKQTVKLLNRLVELSGDEGLELYEKVCEVGGVESFDDFLSPKLQKKRRRENKYGKVNDKVEKRLKPISDKFRDEV